MPWDTVKLFGELDDIVMTERPQRWDASSGQAGSIIGNSEESID